MNTKESQTKLQFNFDMLSKTNQNITEEDCISLILCCVMLGRTFMHTETDFSPAARREDRVWASMPRF